MSVGGTFPIMLALHILPTRFFRAEVDYEMDGESALEWEKFSEFFSALKTNKKLWVVETSKRVAGVFICRKSTFVN